MTNEELMQYWLKTAKHDYDTMLGLYGIKRYSDCLFYGHIVLEKVLKALVVKNTKKAAPPIHDLVRLQEIAGLGFSESTVDLLDQINEFNMRTRYPELKLDFYKKCTANYAKKYFEQIKKIYKELCQKIKQ